MLGENSLRNIFYVSNVIENAKAIEKYLSILLITKSGLQIVQIYSTTSVFGYKINLNILFIKLLL